MKRSIFNRNPVTSLLVVLSIVLLGNFSVHAEAIPIGPGVDIGAGNFDSGGIRLNIEPATVVNLKAGIYNVLDASFVARGNGVGELIPFLAVLTDAGGLVYETIWAGAPSVPPGGDGTHTVTYPVGSEQFTLAADTDVYAGTWHGDGALVAFNTVATITNHDNSPIKPSGPGEIIDSFSHAGLNNRTYAYEINVENAIPEPSSFLLAVIGLASLGWCAIRRRVAVHSMKLALCDFVGLVM